MARKHKAETHAAKEKIRGKKRTKEMNKTELVSGLFYSVYSFIVSKVPLIYININGGGVFCMEGKNSIKFGPSRLEGYSLPSTLSKLAFSSVWTV